MNSSNKKTDITMSPAELRSHLNTYFKIKVEVSENNKTYPYETTDPFDKIETPYTLFKLSDLDKTNQNNSNDNNENLKIGTCHGVCWRSDQAYWVKEIDNDIIITTSCFAHNSTSNKFPNLMNGSQSDKVDLKDVREKIEKSIEDANIDTQNKTIHFIIPRIEKGAIESHIVLQYIKKINPKNNDIKNDHEINDKDKLDEGDFVVINDVVIDDSIIFDSKSLLSGLTYTDVPRIRTGMQDYSNATDCGYHVVQSIRVIHQLIEGKQDVKENFVKEIKKPEHQLEVTKLMLEKLRKIYKERLDKNVDYNGGLFSQQGFSATQKDGAITAIFKNITENKSPKNDLNESQTKVAEDGVLGRVVKLHIKFYDQKNKIQSQPNNNNKSNNNNNK